MRLTTPHVGDPVGSDFQCTDHRVLIPLALKGVKYRAARRRAAVAPQSADLRAGRNAGAVHRHQARSTFCWPLWVWFNDCGSRRDIMKSLFRPAIVRVYRTDGDHRRRLSAILPAHRQGAFPRQARAPLIERDGRIVGSALIGQNFDAPNISGAVPSPVRCPNNAALPRLNLGPLNPALTDAVKGRIDALQQADPGNKSAGPGRSGHGIGQRAGSGYQSGRGLTRPTALPGHAICPRRESAN